MQRELLIALPISLSEGTEKCRQDFSAGCILKHGWRSHNVHIYPIDNRNQCKCTLFFFAQTLRKHSNLIVTNTRRQPASHASFSLSRRPAVNLNIKLY